MVYETGFQGRGFEHGFKPGYEAWVQEDFIALNPIIRMDRMDRLSPISGVQKDIESTLSGMLCMYELSHHMNEIAFKIMLFLF